MSTPTFPIEKPFSKKTKGRYGYRDGRVEIDAKIGIMPTFTEKMTIDELKEITAFFQEALRFAEMPEADRERLGAE